jgi:hypothetical protein
MEQPTQGQIAFLRDLGVTDFDGLTKQTAGQLIEQLKAKRDAGRNLVALPTKPKVQQADISNPSHRKWHEMASQYAYDSQKQHLTNDQVVYAAVALADARVEYPHCWPEVIRSQFTDEGLEALRRELAEDYAFEAQAGDRLAPVPRLRSVA